jgi:hypothetical protein
MRHETRVWLFPVLIAIALCGVALVPSSKREPEPEPPPIRPVPVSAFKGYLYFLVFARALPPPFPAGLHPRLLVIEGAPYRAVEMLKRSRAMPRAR